MPFSARQSIYLSNPVPAAAGRSAQTFAGTGSVTTAQKKFGSASVDIENVASNPRFTLTGYDDATATIECWFRYPSFAVNGYRTIWGSHNGTSLINTSLAIYNDNLITIQNLSNNTDFNLGIILATNTWYHCVLTKSSTTYKLFINGTQRGGDKTLAGTLFESSHRIVFGKSNLASTTVGFLDELRVSKILRYTGNFTEPTSAFTNDSNTILLCHCEVAPLVDDAS